MSNLTMEKLVNLCKQYGFIFQGSEIYGGLANTWDYGPLGTRLKNNIKDAWRKRFIQERKNSFETDTTILMHSRVWEASGHVDSFNDPKFDCKNCKTRYRADNFIEEYSLNHDSAQNMAFDEMTEYIKNNSMKCPKCGSSNFTDVREFKLMFETYRGTTEDNKTVIYLRPENAQGEYVNYLNVLRSSRTKLPFSIGQIGTVFRNEVTPGDFIFRTIEFEQMEYQTFCKPGDDVELYKYFKEYGKKFYLDLGLSNDKLRFKDHEKLSFYASAACDIEYLFPFGWGELNGTHDRTDYDLKRHQEFSGQNMEYIDSNTNEKFIPYVVESTYGVGRTVLACLFEAYHEETLEDGTIREVMRLHPYLAPYKVAIFPLIKKNHSDKANELFDILSKHFMVTYDESSSIGKRYRRQDVIGTPYCITIDDNTLNNNTVTIRDRDTMKQEVLDIEDIVDYINEKIAF
ncbi:MAG: glycine--tRNA ligase [Bacilli bacterium]